MAQDEADVDAGGGSSKVFLVLGLLGGLAIGGGGGYYYFKSVDPTAQTAGEEKPKKPKGPLHSITFERLAVPIYASGGRFIGNYFIDLAVQVRGNDHQITVKRSQPQLQHAFLSAISQANLMREDAPTQIDHDKAAAVLKKKADEILGRGIVEDVAILNSMRLSR